MSGMLYSWAIIFYKVVWQQIWGDLVGITPASIAVHFWSEGIINIGVRLPKLSSK